MLSMERSPERVTQRNGYRSGAWDTPGRDDGSAHPEASRGELFPEPAGATASQRASSAGCDPAGLRGRCIHKAGGPIWSRPWGCEGISNEPGVAHLSGTGRGVDGFMGRPLGGGPYPYLWLGRTDPEGQGGRQDRQRQRGGGDGRQWRGQAGNHWDGRGYQ